DLGVDGHLLELRELFLDDRCGDREVAVLDDDFLALPGQDKLCELARQRVERLARRTVDVDVEEARQRVLPRVRVLGRRVDALAALFLRERHRADARGGVPDAAVADPAAVDGDALNDGRRARLLLHGVLEVAVLQGVLLEEAVRARRRVAAVEAEGRRGPRAREAELTPAGDVLLEAVPPRLREDGVHL